jgi:hypothetical protein
VTTYTRLSIDSIRWIEWLAQVGGGFYTIPRPVLLAWIENENEFARDYHE